MISAGGAVVRVVRLLIAVILLASATLAQQGPPTPSSLSEDIQRLESVREIKDVQRSFAQLAQFGRWADMAVLFTENGTLQWGNSSTAAIGPVAIEAWLYTDAGNMDGVNPASLNTLVAENPLITLSADGHSAKGRWNVLRLGGDGRGRSRMEGGIFENEFVFVGDRWKISRLHFYPLYKGDYSRGWRTVGRGAPIVPYHYSPADVGVPVPPSKSSKENATFSNATLGGLERRITRLNDEDDVRNLQASYGYYVDRRMWDDVVDLFIANATVNQIGDDILTGEPSVVTTLTGRDGVRKAMERMGPQGLTFGTLNDYPQFDTIVWVHPNGREAIARGTEIGMLGNLANNISFNNNNASWAFNVFRNRFVKEEGVWRFSEMSTATLMRCIYVRGWTDGDDRGGGLAYSNTTTPPFLEISARTAHSKGLRPFQKKDANIATLRRKLARSQAFDGAENVSNGYGYYLDDLQCEKLGAVHAEAGHKLSPFAGWYHGRDRIIKACQAAWGGRNQSVFRPDVAFHWRTQPVISVSQDGQSASIRARLFQPVTSANSSKGFNAGMYHDQAVLEDGAWRLWSVTIDEHYWTTDNWEDGWLGGALNRSNATSSPSALLTKYPPDVTVVDVGEREATFRGGSGKTITWPDIQLMWFTYRNPVSGRMPEHYWPGCVPCKKKPEWSLLSNKYQEPPTGPTSLKVTHSGGEPGSLTIVVAGGPDEPAGGDIEVVGGNDVRLLAGIPPTGTLTLTLPEHLSPGTHRLAVKYLGSDRLRPAETVVSVTVG